MRFPLPLPAPAPAAPPVKSLLAALLLVAPLACAGRELSSSSGEAHPDGGDAGGADSGSADARDAGHAEDAAPVLDATIDCGQPSQVVYSCTPNNILTRPECHRYGGPLDVAPLNAHYPEGCTVTLPECNPDYFTPQTCTCGLFPLGDGGPQWTCPL